MSLKKSKIIQNGVLLIVLSMMLSGCFNLTKHLKTLDPEEKAFFYDVQPLMTRLERDVYFSLTKAERTDFVKRFWQIRNLTPNSEENEFRDEYYKRVKVAKKAFWTDGMGLMGDRSRVYLLLGPPDNSQDYPVIQSSKYRALQKWIYSWKGLVVYFADINGIGKYELYNPPGQLQLYLDLTQTNFFGIERDKKWLDFRFVPGKENLIVKVRASSIEYKDQKDAMNYSLTVRIAGLKENIFVKTYKGRIEKKDGAEIPTFQELVIPYQTAVQKQPYFYFTIYDNIGESFGGKIIKRKFFNK